MWSKLKKEWASLVTCTSPNNHVIILCFIISPRGSLHKNCPHVWKWPPYYPLALFPHRRHPLSTPCTHKNGRELEDLFFFIAFFTSQWQKAAKSIPFLKNTLEYLVLKKQPSSSFFHGANVDEVRMYTSWESTNRNLTCTPTPEQKYSR